MDTEKYQRIIRDSNIDFLNWTAKKGYVLNQVVGNSIMWFRSKTSIGVSAIELHNQYIKELENNFENKNMETHTEKYVVMIEGRNTPTKIHDSYETAEKEAKRLCEKERRNAHVLKIVSLIEIPPIEFKITKF